MRLDDSLYYRLMATVTNIAFETLLKWSDDVHYITKNGRDPVVVAVFNTSESFFLWKDYNRDTPLPYTYVRLITDRVCVTVSVQSFVRALVPPKKWHVSNRGVSSTVGMLE